MARSLLHRLAILLTGFILLQAHCLAVCGIEDCLRQAAPKPSHCHPAPEQKDLPCSHEVSVTRGESAVFDAPVFIAIDALPPLTETPVTLTGEALPQVHAPPFAQSSALSTVVLRI